MGNKVLIVGTLVEVFLASIFLILNVTLNFMPLLYSTIIWAVVMIIFIFQAIVVDIIAGDMDAKEKELDEVKLSLNRSEMKRRNLRKFIKRYL